MRSHTRSRTEPKKNNFDIFDKNLKHFFNEVLWSEACKWEKYLIYFLDNHISCFENRVLKFFIQIWNIFYKLFLKKEKLLDFLFPWSFHVSKINFDVLVKNWETICKRILYMRLGIWRKDSSSRSNNYIPFFENQFWTPW